MASVFVAAHRGAHLASAGIAAWVRASAWRSIAWAWRASTPLCRRAAHLCWRIFCYRAAYVTGGETASRQRAARMKTYEKRIFIAKSSAKKAKRGLAPLLPRWLYREKRAYRSIGKADMAWLWRRTQNDLAARCKEHLAS